MTSLPLDRRRAPRFPAHVRAQYVGDARNTPATAYDLSTVGAFIRTDAADLPGTSARLRVRSPMVRDDIELPCRVARREDGPEPGLGLEFTAPGDPGRVFLERYCHAFTGPERIVMVDDEPAILRMVGRVLSREGLPFVGIDLPVQTEQTLERFGPDLVILDVMMPVTNGIEVARRMRASSQTRHIPILFYSSFSPSALPEDLRHLPFLTKGCPVADLVSAIKVHAPQAHVH